MVKVGLVILTLGAAFVSLIGYVLYSILHVHSRWRAAEIERLMDQWAAANGVHIVALQQPSLREVIDASAFGRIGPFLGTSNAQALVRATAADRKGRERSGWFLLGGFFSGLLFSERVVVKWDDRDENPAGTASGVYDSWLDD